MITVNFPTSLSHEPVANISGCCRDEYDIGRHLVLLIFWDTYLAFIHSMDRQPVSTSQNQQTIIRISLAFMNKTEQYAPATSYVKTVAELGQTSQNPLFVSYRLMSVALHLAAGVHVTAVNLIKHRVRNVTFSLAFPNVGVGTHLHI